MFKGFNKKFQEELEKNNRDSSRFYFSFADLELVEVNGKRRKCRILSEEVREKLHKLVSGGPKPTFVEFDTWLGGVHYELPFPNLSGNLDCIKYWLKIKKYEKPEWKKYRKALEDIKVSQDGVLSIEYFEMSDCVKEIDDFYGSVHDNEGGEYSWNYRKGWDDRLGWTISGGYVKLHPGYDKKIKETHPARVSAIQAINNTINNGNIDFITLKEASMFLGESYLQAWPDDCLYCPKEYEKDPDNVAEYHQTHINKCLWRPDRINDFKDSQIALLQRIINNFNEYKNSVIKEIIQKANSQSITETDLNTTRSGWQNHLLSLKNRNEIKNYQNQLENDIQNLVSAKNKPDESSRKKAETAAQENAQKEEERLKKEREEKAKKAKEIQTQKETEAKKRALEDQKTNSITKITSALNQEPQLNNSDLSSEYQNWETKIQELTETNLIIDWESKVLTDIQARRQDKKTAQEVKENLNQFQNPESTPQQKKAALDNLEKNEGEQAYEEQKEEINQAKQEQATQNPTEYSQDAANKIIQKMQEEGISETDLNENNNQTKNLFTSLKNGQIKDPTKIVAAENEIRQRVWQTKVEKEIQTLTSEVNQVLQTNQSKKEDITKIKQKLVEFLAKSNVYYSSQHQKAQALLTKLESYLNTNQPRSNNPISSSSLPPWKIIIPLLLVGMVLLIVVLIMVKRVIRRRKRSKKIP